jgi:hypothetical protein
LPFSYITDFDSHSVLALVATATRSEAPHLKDFIYKHLVFETSIGVTIGVSRGDFSLTNAAPSVITHY